MSSKLFDLTGKTAIVTGGNGGIGYGMASEIGKSGANVVITGRNSGKTKEAVNELKKSFDNVIGIDSDVSDEASIKDMIKISFDTFGSIDVLINNAGIGIREFPENYSTDDWNQVININLTGAFLCSREVYPFMKSQGSGKIINIGSMTSIFGLDWAVAYASSKGGIVQLTKTLAVSWAKDNIQSNCILPGWIHTDLTQGIKDQFQDRYKQILSRIPSNRWGEPDDLAGTAVYLSSSASDYVNGVSIAVDGGYTSF